MATTLKQKVFPSGLSPKDLKYQGRPANETDDFDSEVGLADMACVNQFGEANNAKFYHCGVVVGDGRWFVYTEWGKIKGGKSWRSGGFHQQSYMFIECEDEDEARKEFAKIAKKKNIRRVHQIKVGGKTIWASKPGKDGYIVQSLATRERGLPDAYTIKDTTGIQVQSKAPKKAAAKKPSQTFHPQEISFTQAIIGGTQDYARAAQAATSVIPTMATIQEVRNDFIPAALKRIKRIGGDVDKQILDSKLIDLSKLVAALVPRPLDRKLPADERAKAVIMSTANIFALQQDLDAFEAALQSEDFSVDDVPETFVDVDKLMNAQIRWIDPDSTEGRYVSGTFHSMTNNRHYDLRSKKAKIKAMFRVSRSDRDDQFIAEVKRLAALRKGFRHEHVGRLQPNHRPDLSDISDYAADANVFLGIHGTRSVNVSPILRTHLRMPKSLKGVRIAGSAFGHGIYQATDWKKSWGYVGNRHTSGGRITGRGWHMFLCDVAAGRMYPTSDTCWDRVEPPRGYDSIAAFCELTSVENDEHVSFDPRHIRIRYIIEGEV